jgi:hypothetical protein
LRHIFILSMNDVETLKKSNAVFNYLFSFVPTFYSGEPYSEFCAQRTAEVKDIFVSREYPGAVSFVSIGRELCLHTPSGRMTINEV